MEVSSPIRRGVVPRGWEKPHGLFFLSVLLLLEPRRGHNCNKCTVKWGKLSPNFLAGGPKREIPGNLKALGLPQRGKILGKKPQNVVYELLGSLLNCTRIRSQTDRRTEQSQQTLRTELNDRLPLATGWHKRGTDPNSIAKAWKIELALKPQPQNTDWNL